LIVIKRKINNYKTFFNLLAKNIFTWFIISIRKKESVCNMRIGVVTSQNFYKKGLFIEKPLEID